jgi:ABC-type transport system involved in multi-copper enzyme maturation permease subunit
MKTRLLIAGGWLRRQFAWSNTRQSWQERLGFIGLIAGGAAGWHFSENWSPEQRIVLLAAWLLGLALLLRRGLLKLFGPVFFYEVLRGSRRRVHLVRTIYAVILLVAVSYPFLLREELDLNVHSLQGQAEMAEFLFRVFFFLQLGLICLLTPLMVAGAITSEKEHRTLEFMLATDLRSREIVLGKLAGRLANMTLFLLAGLPIIAILQLLGGIDPDLLFIGFAATGLTFISLAAVSIWHSAMLKRTRDAIITTFISVAGYLVLSGLAQLLKMTSFAHWSVGFGERSVTGNDILDAIGAGNIFVHIGTIEKQLFTQGSFNDILPQLLKEYAIFHIGVTVACLVWAMARLRPVAIVQSVGGEVKRRWRRTRAHPRIGTKPMIWKEVYAESGLRLHWVAKIIVLLLMLASFWPPVQITAEHWDQLLGNLEGYSSAQSGQGWSSSNPWDRYMEEMNAWTRGMTGTVGTLMLFAAAVRASGSITGERARQTLDELLASPLENREIIHGKWLGSILSVRRGWIWLGLILLVGVVSGGVNWLGVLLVISCWFIYAGFFTLLGLWFSTVCRNSIRSTVATLLSTCFVLGGHWIISFLLCFLPIGLFGSHSSGDERDMLQWLAALQLGFTPPFVLGAAATRDLLEWFNLREEESRFVIGAFLGLGGFLFGAIVLWSQLLQRFARTYSRTERRLPERKYKSKPDVLDVLPAEELNSAGDDKPKPSEG